MSKKVCNFAPDFRINMVGVAQLVRVPDCGSEGRGFESLLPPQKQESRTLVLLFLVLTLSHKTISLSLNLPHTSVIYPIVLPYLYLIYSIHNRINKV